jgi:haloalkane dehalogenase
MLLKTRPFLASPDRVKGTDAASVALVLDERITIDAKARGMKHRDATREAIDVHRAAGRRFTAGGTTSFVREQGRGAPVVLLHGVPSSSFLYRKVIPTLAEQGLRGLAFDFPGLGLADRPVNFDYSWSGLARWTGEAIDALGIERCHLVVHDIGGPIGFEWAIHNRERVHSLTALNTMLKVAGFRRPWSMRPFAVRGLGELWLRSTPRFAFSELFYRQGVADRGAVPRHEVYAHYELLKRADGGRAFLRIMRGFELTEAKQRFLWEGMAERPYPTRIVWGERDQALGLDQMRVVQRVLRVDDPILLPAKHFLQEDQAKAVANSIADLAAPLG